MKDYIRHLGILIDSNLSWKFHIDYICQKVSRRSRSGKLNKLHVGFCFFSSSSHCHVVFELFGILSSPKQPKWIKCPFPQPVLWHSSSLSVSVAWVLQMQMVLHSMAAWVTADACLPFVDFLLGLNWGSLQQCEQYQIFSVGTSLRDKHEMWNFPWGHSTLLHDTTWLLFWPLQKQIPCSSGTLLGTSHLLVNHLPRISGRMQILQNSWSFGKTLFECSRSG